MERINSKGKEMRKFITVITATVLATSCGIYNRYQPETEVREDLYGEDISTADSISIGDLDWRDFFTDPYLAKLIDSALVRNSDMRTAMLKVKEAEASLLSARLAYLPSFSLTPQGGINGNDQGLSQGGPTYTVPVNASWEVDIFGKTTNAKRRTKAAYMQTLEYRQAVRSQIISSVANLYYTLLMLDSQLEITEETKATWEESVRTTRAMKDAGMVTEAALAQTEATYYSICTSVLDLRKSIVNTENSLALLLADTPGTIERGKLENQTFTADIKTGVPVMMLSNRPDVRQAEFALEQAYYGTNQARAAFYPSITLSGTAGWTNSIGNVITNPAQFIFSALASLTEPIFNKATNITNLRIAKAQLEEARIAFEQTLLAAGLEVNDALAAYQTAVGKTEWIDRQIESLETAVRSTELLMMNSNTTYLEVLTARQGLLNARLSRTANMCEEIQSLISLYKALGGGREMEKDTENM